jgi:flagellar hook protein FlgE
MSILGSLFAAVSGINGQSQRLGTISDNIANVSTSGYKRMETQFSTFVTESTISRHSPGGVISRPQTQIASQGLLQATLNNTDLAISGTGYFVVNQSPKPTVGDQYLYTRAGSFQADKNGNLINTAGYYLQGWPLTSTGNLPTNNGSLISLQAVNVGQVTGKPSATTKVDMGLNLPANSAKNSLGDGTISDAVRNSDLVVFDSLGISQTIRVTWSHLSNNTWALTINPGTGTINDVLDSTAVSLNTSNGFSNTLSSSLTSATNKKYLVASFNSDGTLADIKDPTSSKSVISNLDGTVKVNMDFSASGSSNNQTISFNFGTKNQANGLAQYDADFFTSYLNQNGVRFGSFTGVNIGKDGKVTAIFDNGQTQPLYQVPLVSFANPNGLEVRGGNAYAQTEAAGEFILREAGASGTGQIISSSLEQSTVDLATEFSNMILTQRAYSANSKVISTADSMLEELIRVVN